MSALLRFRDQAAKPTHTRAPVLDSRTEQKKKKKLFKLAYFTGESINDRDEGRKTAAVM